MQSLYKVERGSILFKTGERKSKSTWFSEKSHNFIILYSQQIKTPTTDINIQIIRIWNLNEYSYICPAFCSIESLFNQ